MTPRANRDPYDSGRADDNDEDPDDGDNDKDEELGGVLPLAWRMEQMRMEERMMKSMREAMREVVREEMGQGLKEIKGE
eukprot:8153679-Karenia_brevis.AAC.1